MSCCQPHHWLSTCGHRVSPLSAQHPQLTNKHSFFLMCLPLYDSFSSLLSGINSNPQLGPPNPLTLSKSSLSLFYPLHHLHH
ncbi:hypothetical protein RIF29_37272 [Crotalaria pallida]|uniref:Uncharacterized protein n=1 Tax=Crotalaria pallida TaxID=3830 RepID=A0AAN9HSQ0_CROPI